MRRVALTITILALLFAGSFATLTARTSFSPANIRQAPVSNITRLGIDCGLGSTQAVVNASGFPVAPSENGNPELLNRCNWIGDAGQTVTGSSDGTTEPLVTDQDEALSSISPAIGGGFTANVVILQNSTSEINGFDLQVHWNPAILRAVEFDQTGLPWLSRVLLTPERIVDNYNGLAELAQVVQGNFTGDFTLFRIRFDIVGVGVTSLNIVDVSGGLANPGSVIHQNLNGSFDSESILDPSHTLDWTANLTTPSPTTPSSPNIFIVKNSCPGCTTPFTYQWQFNSTNTSPFITEATGNPVTITLPTPTLVADRITVLIKDSATPTPNSATLTVSLPLTVSIQSPNSLSVGTPANWTGYWLGGNPSYTERWRLCPGTSTNKLVCSNPNPSFSQQGQLSDVSASYNFAGIYQNTLTVTDTASPITGSSTRTAIVPANVTGKPAAFNVVLNASGGPSVTFTAIVAYNSTYPSAFRSTQFSYFFLFGDGYSQSVTGTTSTVLHTYLRNGTYAPSVVVKETGLQAPSQISETGRTTITVITHGFYYAISLTPQGQTSSGQAFTTKVFVDKIFGSTDTVNLSAVFSIPGTTVSFAPSLGTPTFTSTMTINTSPTTPSGIYSIIVQGNSTTGVMSKSTFTLAVNVPLPSTPILGVYSSHYGTANITDTSLTPGSKFSVQVNVTNPSHIGWNGYELTLYYDQRYINITSYDATTNTVFPDPSVEPNSSNSPGALRLSVLSPDAVGVGSGMLVNITFTVLKLGVSPLMLAPGTTAHASDAGPPLGICPNCSYAPNWSTMITPNSISVETLNGYFNNIGGNPGPVASFTYTPTTPLQGQTTTFNATSSFDTDNNNGLQHGIKEYMWDFGETTRDGNQTTLSPITTHRFQHFGNYTVRLTVIDLDNGFAGMAVVRLSTAPIHDIALSAVGFSSPKVSQGQPIIIFASVTDLADVNDLYSLNVSYSRVNTSNQTLIGSLYQVYIDAHKTVTDGFFLNTTRLAPGTYIVTAVASVQNDNNTSNNRATGTFQVTTLPPHDVSVQYIQPNSNVAFSGQTILFYVGIQNTGANYSTITVTLFYNGTVAASITGITIPNNTSTTITLPWKTIGVKTGNYTISATATLPDDPTLADNSLTSGRITIVPPPTMTLTPTSGPVGTKVEIHGAGFALPRNNSFLLEPDVTFDNQFVGFIPLNNSSFIFTFNVPVSQPGTHQIHATFTSFFDVQATFTVTSTPGAISVSVSTGTIYFPGDSTTIFILTGLNGSPSTVTTLQVTLINPDNTNVTMKTRLVTNGLYKTNYTIPANGQIGTYALLVRAHLTGAADGQALTTFEVKPTWLSSNGRNITTAAAITGLVGVAALAWKKGYFKREDEDEEPENLNATVTATI